MPNSEDAVYFANEFTQTPHEAFTTINNSDEEYGEDAFKPTAPLASRPTSSMFHQDHRPSIKKKCRISPIIIPSCLVLVVNVIAFSLLMRFRQFNTQRLFDVETMDSYRTLAKNSALMTVINLFSVFMSLAMKTRRVHIILVVPFFIFAMMHVFGHITIASRNDIMRYIKQTWLLTLSGIVILVTLVMLCLSKCLRDYSKFYIVHIISTTVLIISTTTHSYWFAVAFIYPLLILAVRLLRRSILNIELKPITVGETFIFFELMIKDTFLNQCLALNYLKRHNGNVVGWVSCKHTNSAFERHPFSILSTYDGCGQCHSQIIMSKFGDWKANLHALIRSNHLKSLYSCGVECYLDAFTTDENLAILKKYSHILFILENLDIARFLSFITLINDSKNRKLRTIVRQIELHFKFDDYLLHDIIREYTSRSLVNSESSSFHLNISLYYVSDSKSPELNDKIKSSHVHYVTLKRLNHTQIIQKFVSRYYKDKLANKRASLKIVSSEEKKVVRAVKHITSHKKSIIVI